MAAGPAAGRRGADAAPRLLPRFHRAFPSASGWATDLRLFPFRQTPWRCCVFRNPGPRLLSGGSRLRGAPIVEPGRGPPGLLCGEEAGNWTPRGPSPLNLGGGNRDCRSWAQLAGPSFLRSGWRCVMPAHLALFRPQREGLAAAFEGFTKSDSRPLGKFWSPPCSAEAGQGLLTGAGHAPRSLSLGDVQHEKHSALEAVAIVLSV